MLATCPRVHVSTCPVQESGTTRASATAACPSASSRARPSASRASATRSPPPAPAPGAPVLMPHYCRWRTRSARGSPPPPRCPAATTPHAPRSAWTRPRTTSVPDRWHGHTLIPPQRTSQPHNFRVFSVRSSRVTARVAARSAPPPAWRPPPGASVCPSASSTQATPSAAGV